MTGVDRGARGGPGPRLDSKPIYEALVGWLRKSGGWLAGEIWLKSASSHHKKRG